jgi:uncharacterized protein YcbK (DUF882 family)
MRKVKSGSNRRQFLKGIGGAWGVVAVGGLSRPAAAEVSATRTLSFLHTHTGESLTTTYFDGGVYRPDSLAQVNVFLRDFRNGEVHAIDPALLDILHALQSRTSGAGVFEVISGYRSAATNAMLRRHSDGVAQHSMHLLGKAIDIRLQGFHTETLGQVARDLARGGVGYYAASDFVHVDTGPVRHW